MLYQVMLGCTGKCLDVLGYARMCKDVQLANSKAANFGDCDYDHDIHANGFIFFMVDR